MTPEQKEKDERDQELKDIRKILQTQEGFRFFRRFIEKAMIFRTTFTGNSTGYLYEGKRALGLEFWADIVESSPDLIAKILIPTPVLEEEKKTE